jgi:hypothetical protein
MEVWQSGIAEGGTRLVAVGRPATPFGAVILWVKSLYERFLAIATTWRCGMWFASAELWGRLDRLGGSFFGADVGGQVGVEQANVFAGEAVVFVAEEGDEDFGVEDPDVAAGGKGPAL